MRHPKKAVPERVDDSANAHGQSDQAAQSNLDRRRLPTWLVAMGDSADCALGVDAYERLSRP